MKAGVALSAGDQAANEQGERSAALMREHGPVLARVCMALVGDAAAAEIALERVARDAGAATFEEGKSPLSRLMGFARAACSNQLSKLPIRSTAAWGAAGAACADPPKEALPHRARASAVARAAIGKLKPTEREAVILHLVGGLDTAQIAEACGIDTETARGRVARGVAQLVEQEKKR